MSQPLALLYYANLMPGSQLANRLMDLGYRVQVLPDLAQLGQSCQTEKPLLVVMELTPAGAVCAAVTALKAEASTQHLPVLAYAAATDAQQQQAARTAGVTLLAGAAAVSEHLPRLLDQVLQLE